MIVYGTVVRDLKNASPLGTPGVLRLENGFSSDTLELPWHDNARGRSCVRPGPSDANPEVYYGRVWRSPSLKRLVIRFEDKNGRYDCLVHNANFASEERDLDGDGVSEVAQIHGCTAVGAGYGEILRKDGHKQWGIKFSGSTLAALIESLRDKNVTDPVMRADGFVTGYHDVEITYRWE